MKITIAIIKQKIKDLQQKRIITDRFNQCLPPEESAIFQTKYSVTLPADYVSFLTEVGNGGPGPNYGILSLQESVIDFKLDSKPTIDISANFKYNEAWNENWISSFDWDHEHPDLKIVNDYMDVNHISGCLQISHYGHCCTNLLVVSGVSKGQIWFDGRADYSGIEPEKSTDGYILDFFGWYSKWLAEIEDQ